MSSCRVKVIDHLPSPRPFAHARTQRLLDDVNVVCSWLSDPSLRLTPQFNCNVRERFLTLTEIYFSQLLVASSLWTFCDPMSRSSVLKPPSGSLRLCQPCGAEFGKGRWIVLFALRTHRPLFVLPL